MEIIGNNGGQERSDEQRVVLLVMRVGGVSLCVCGMSLCVCSRLLLLLLSSSILP